MKYLKKIYILLFLNCIFIFFPHFLNKPYALDREIIIKPLQSVSSPSEYLAKLNEGKILDVQPIRDISHLIDIFIEKSFGFSWIGELHNLFLLLLTCIFLFEIFKKYFEEKIAVLGVFIFCNHPTIFNIFIEETSRKHILAVLFTLISFYFFKSDRLANNIKYRLISYISFLLSLLSCPITILFPIFIVPKKKEKLRESIPKILPFFIISLSLGIINIYYYKYTFKDLFGFERAKEILGMSDLSLILSMYFRQYFFPFIYSIYYIIYSKINLCFLILSPFIIWFSFKKEKKASFQAYFGIFLVMFTLYGTGTNIIMLNTYNLIPTILFTFLVISILKERKRILQILLFCLFFISTYQSYNRPYKKIDFFNSIAENEPNCRLIQALLFYAIEDGNLNDIQKWYPKWVNYKCLVAKKGEEYYTPLVATFVILLSTDYTMEQKKEMFNKKFKSKNDIKVLEAYLELENSNFEKFDEIIMELDIEKNNSMFLAKTLIIYKKFTAYCKNKRGNQSCQKLKEYIDKTSKKPMSFELL